MYMRVSVERKMKIFVTARQSGLDTFKVSKYLKISIFWVSSGVDGIIIAEIVKQVVTRFHLILFY